MSDNLSPPTLYLLCDELKQVVEWDKLAVYLKVPYVDIEDARERHRGTWQRKMHCFKKWLDQSNATHARSWHTVADAVENVNPAIAEHIRQKYASILDQASQHDDDHQPANDSIIKEHQMHKLCLAIEMSIAKNISSLESRFAKLVTETQTFLQQKSNTLVPFYRYLKIQMFQGQTRLPDEDHITYNMLFNILDCHWHFLKCQLLQRIVQKFLSDSDMPSKVQKYQNDLSLSNSQRK